MNKKSLRTLRVYLSGDPELVAKFEAQIYDVMEELGEDEALEFVYRDPSRDEDVLSMGGVSDKHSAHPNCRPLMGNPLDDPIFYSDPQDEVACALDPGCVCDEQMAAFLEASAKQAKFDAFIRGRGNE